MDIDTEHIQPVPRNTKAWKAFFHGLDARKVKALTISDGGPTQRVLQTVKNLLVTPGNTIVRVHIAERNPQPIYEAFRSPHCAIRRLIVTSSNENMSYPPDYVLRKLDALHFDVPIRLPKLIQHVNTIHIGVPV